VLAGRCILDHLADEFGATVRVRRYLAYPTFQRTLFK